MQTISKADQRSKVQNMLNTEWLLSNKRGGFSCGTLANCNTRRYHSLLTASLHPPAKRIKALSAIQESITVDSSEITLTNFEFPKVPFSSSSVVCDEFSQDIGAHFVYNLGFADIKRSIYLDPQADRIAISYEFSNMTRTFSLKLTPLVSINDFHALQKSTVNFEQEIVDDELVLNADDDNSVQLRTYCDGGEFVSQPNWWYNFHYRVEHARGQDHLEDLYSPGNYICQIDQPGRVVFWASLSDEDMQERLPDLDVDIICDSISIEQKDVLKNIHRHDMNFKDLCLAADRFVVYRNINNKETATILAGYPWFLDWGRDTFISLKGLLLDTGRFEQARQVLTTFASAIDEGMIPNRFDDYTNTPHYNSIDASLWYINACFDYLRASSDKQTFITELLPTIKWIVDAYSNGTKFGIHADHDGLIMGGSQKSQLTWMDAKCNGVTFTPRYGKAVEINALWHNGLCQLANYYKDKPVNGDGIDYAERYSQMADEVEDSFRAAFWNSDMNCLHDCIFTDGNRDASIRPNQIFAVSLEYSPLSIDEQCGVVDVVSEHLLTPYGLRTLSRNDMNYQPRYSGDMFSRDKAYHQGTVWPWLIGPYIKAYLRVNNYSYSAKTSALEIIRPLTEHFDNSGCVKSINEVFDGDPPHHPKGCFAQAWSVAQLIEVFRLITE